MNAQVNSYIKQLIQLKSNVSSHDRDLYRLKPKLAPPKKSPYQTRAE